MKPQKPTLMGFRPSDIKVRVNGLKCQLVPAEKKKKKPWQKSFFIFQIFPSKETWRESSKLNSSTVSDHVSSVTLGGLDRWLGVPKLNLPCRVCLIFLNWCLPGEEKGEHGGLLSKSGSLNSWYHCRSFRDPNCRESHKSCKSSGGCRRCCFALYVTLRAKGNYER